MTTTPDPDTAVLVSYAAAELNDAVHNLFSDRITTIPGNPPRITRLASRYQEIRAAIAGQQGTQTGSIARSMPPLWVDATDWLRRVDNQTRDWIPANTTATTPNRWLAQLELTWRPQDTTLLQQWTEELEHWTRLADQLLGNTDTALPVRAPCPRCGRRWHYRKDTGGEIVRVDSLQITRGVGCRCQGCRASWTEREYEFLGRLIGCDALPGAMDT